ncbi:MULTISPECIES: type IV pilin-like G/H family protein [unclassified Microcoleus]|uniref:type IV pilin-like G/H family protein n=1 Tax=unclassified Microcoleus TaxID=2642155 RepID=UPI002FCECFA6
MQLKKNPQLNAVNKQAELRTTMQVQTKPQLDPLNKQAASTKTMQVKKNPQLDPLNKKTASTTTMQVKTKPQLDAINKKTASTTTMQVKTKPQLDAINKQAASTTTMQVKVKKNPQLDALNKPAASTTTMQVKKNLQLNALNKQTASSEKNIIHEKKSKSGGGSLLKILFIYFPLLVVILATIALPELARCRPYKAMQSEAKQYVSSINRAQQAKHADYGAFSNSITALGIGIKTQTTNYNYSAIATKNAAFSYAVSRSDNLRSYIGAVFLLPVSPANNDKTTVGILCEANSPGKTQPPNPILHYDGFVCADGSTAVSK